MANRLKFEPHTTLQKLRTGIRHHFAGATRPPLGCRTMRAARASSSHAMRMTWFTRCLRSFETISYLKRP
jgi:hypothetical protein